MSMKHSVLVAALATAALATVACGQRSADTPSGSVGSAGQSTDSQSTDKMQAQQPQASEETQKQAANADDTAINAKVKAAIMADPSLKGISVDTKNATVTLSGSVDSDMLRDRAKQIAMATEGVRNVVDNLNVRTS